MKECRCRKPAASPRSLARRRCARCAGALEAEWVASDETFATFFDQLERSIPGWPDPPAAFVAFRRQAETRERAGRERFGFAYLDRDNPHEATEEAADLAIYAWLHTLERLRAGDDDLELALHAARKAYEAFEALARLTRRGAPRGA